MNQSGWHNNASNLLCAGAFCLHFSCQGKKKVADGDTWVQQSACFRLFFMLFCVNSKVIGGSSSRGRSISSLHISTQNSLRSYCLRLRGHMEPFAVSYKSLTPRRLWTDDGMSHGWKGHRAAARASWLTDCKYWLCIWMVSAVTFSEFTVFLCFAPFVL